MLERQNLLIGRWLTELRARKLGYASLAELEFRVFSQFCDDGIIQYLIHHLDVPHRTFVEFGVEDCHEFNTRFLLMNDDCAGFVMDGSEINVGKIRTAHYYWRHDLTARAAFITRENINALLDEGTAGWPGVDLLHIDLDGNDYWIWQTVAIRPVIVVAEYNSTFGAGAAVTILYDATFVRTRAHYSNLYWGASLKALNGLAEEKGYVLIGCNSAGNNAYFVRRGKLTAQVKAADVATAYVRSKSSEARNHDGQLTFASYEERSRLIARLPVFNLEQNRVASFMPDARP